MASDLKIAGSNNGIGATDAAQSQPTTTSKSKNKQVTSKEDFLNLLVHQLQNQDPLDPMKSEEFAVQLAQFSSLEQLISINQKLGGAGSGESSVGTMASYLGQQVSLKSDEPVVVKNGAGPDLSLDLPAGAHSARVDFLDADGKVVGSHVVENLLDGKQAISLTGMKVPNGSYEVSVKAVSASGQFVDVAARQTGLVEGFVLEPTPALLVNGQQVAMEKVAEVSQPLQRAV